MCLQVYMSTFLEVAVSHQSSKNVSHTEYQKIILSLIKKRWDRGLLPKDCHWFTFIYLFYKQKICIRNWLSNSSTDGWGTCSCTNIHIRSRINYSHLCGDDNYSRVSWRLIFQIDSVQTHNMPIQFDFPFDCILINLGLFQIKQATSLAWIWTRLSIFASLKWTYILNVLSCGTTTASCGSCVCNW